MNPPTPPPNLDYASPAQPHSRPSRVLVSTLLAFAAAPLAALYGTWIAAWIALGHRPEPALNDPKSINRLVGAMHDLTVLLVIALPLIAVACVGFLPDEIRSAKSNDSTSRDRLIVVLGNAALWVCVATFALLFLDPLNVLFWFMD